MTNNKKESRDSHITRFMSFSESKDFLFEEKH